MNIKKELLEYLVRSCVREVITQVKEADESKSDFYTDKDGSWCKWCGSKAVEDMGGIKRCKNTTCKMSKHTKTPPQVKEAESAASKDDAFYTDSQGSWCKWCGGKAVPFAGVNRCQNASCKSNRKNKKTPPYPVKEGDDESVLKQRVRDVLVGKMKVPEDPVFKPDSRDKNNFWLWFRNPSDAKTAIELLKSIATVRGQDPQRWILFKLNKEASGSVTEADDQTKGAPAPPADGTGAGENLGIPKEKDATPEPPSEPETPVAPAAKGICFINPRDTSNIIKLFPEPEAPKAKGKPGRKPKSALTPPTPAMPSVPSTAVSPEEPPVVEAIRIPTLSPLAAYSHIPPKQLDRDKIERIIYYTAARFAGPTVKVALSTIRDVEDAIRHDKTLFLYIEKFDETSDEIYVISNVNRQLARDGSLPASELSGTTAPPAPQGADTFDPNTASSADVASYMDKDAPGKVKAYGVPDEPDDLGDVGEQKITEFKKIVKKLVNEVLNR